MYMTQSKMSKNTYGQSSSLHVVPAITTSRDTHPLRSLRMFLRRSTHSFAPMALDRLSVIGGLCAQKMRSHRLVKTMPIGRNIYSNTEKFVRRQCENQLPKSCPGGISEGSGDVVLVAPHSSVDCSPDLEEIIFSIRFEFVGNRLRLK